MSDTPRTDAIEDHGDSGYLHDIVNLCRQLEREVAELQQRLIERTAAYEAKDAKQVRMIQELERGEFICKKCFLRKDSEHPKGDF